VASFLGSQPAVDEVTLTSSSNVFSVKSPNRTLDHFNSAPSGDLVASRALDTSYQAAAGKARLVIAIFHGSGANTDYAELREGVADSPPATPVCRSTWQSTGTLPIMLVGIVRPGYFYRVVDVASTLIGPDSWYERDI